MVYAPTLKTTDAELRAIRHLAPETKRQILPIFEITRSRKTKKDPHGSLIKRVEQLAEVYGDFPAIIDMTTEEDLLNHEIEDLFEEPGGYNSWCQFVETNFSRTIYPCVQFLEGGSEANFREQVRRLAKRFARVALRVSVTDLEAVKLYAWLLDELSSEHVIVIANVYFLEKGLVRHYEGLCSDFITKVIGNRQPGMLSFPSSSFPKAVGRQSGYGEDDAGTIEALELLLDKALRARFPASSLVYSDFGSVHPIRYPTSFGSWIPRIDIPFNGEFSYSRIRREEGGYVAAARLAVEKHGANLGKSWGADQIRAAAAGQLPGANPSFWISARINLWITQQAQRTAQDEHSS